ncbi:MAG: ABC transporter ATP-binding protein [Candidatus Delongbacteria bacterium]|nr:ABC transporter ATP-binding protein [Candidatus Delongbacteria bacterium]MCG2761142.1 ABC transporter ATP-binding protein [Candidatus Delongbacteria bacterium]
MLVNIKELYKRYEIGKKVIPVLKGINFGIEQGEIVAVMGKSGAGKSTLLNLIGTLDKPDNGLIEFRGENILKYSDKKLAEFRNKNLGFVFQFHYLLPEFSALENVMLPGLIKGDNKNDLIKKAEELLDIIGLSDRKSHKSNELSGGEQQRIAFARALINKPSLILADEPSGNLDNVSSEILHDIMWSLARENKTAFIVVTHDKNLAERADRIVNIIDGVI